MKARPSFFPSNQPNALIARSVASNSYRRKGNKPIFGLGDLIDFAFILVLMILLNTFALVSFAAFLCG